VLHNYNTMKHVEETFVDENKVQDDDESSDEKSVKKEVVAPVYVKKVEHLRSIIKACGMSVAPTLYKKAKQAPEEKHETLFIKELQQLLSKEGLSTNPSEKDLNDYGLTTDEDILTEVIKMEFDKDSLIESLRNRVQNEDVYNRINLNEVAASALA
ncbi:high mobility group nucleosome-binding domain-containing protein 5-like protein, partial [Tanacetum coccineum]